MQTASFFPFSTALIAAFAAWPAWAVPALDRDSAARLERLRDDPQAAGDLIYHGAVFALHEPQGAQLYSYERRLKAVGPLLESSHITREPDGEVPIVESARFTPRYELQRFDAINRQAGYSGSVVMGAPGQLHYTLRRGDVVSTATETVNEPVVSGPSLHGYIAQQWQRLLAGERVNVRLIVLEKMQSYRFEIAHVPASQPGRAAFSLRPTHWLLRLAIAPLTVEFETGSRDVARYSGRVPPMRQLDHNKFEPLDARVEYTMHARAYR